MGKLIIFPTDTVYGIGCSIYDLENQKKIYQIKKRDLKKPLACLCANLKQIEEVAVVDEISLKLIKAFLPGPLTIILKTTPQVLKKIGYETIGIRIPNHQLAIKILEEIGPMLTTSVNDSGEAPLNEYQDIYLKYHKIVDEIYQSALHSSNLASTVVKIDDSVQVIREGFITKKQIEEIIYA